MSPHRKPPSLSPHRAHSPLPPIHKQPFYKDAGVVTLNISDIHKSSFGAGVLTSLLIYVVIQQCYLAIFENNTAAITFLVLGTGLSSWVVGRQQTKSDQKRAAQSLSATAVTINPPRDSSREDEQDRFPRSPRKSASPVRSNTFLREPTHNDRDDSGRNLLSDEQFQPHFLPSSPSPPPSPEFETAAAATEKARQKHEESKRAERERERARREKEKERKARKEAKLRHERERKEKEERELEAERKALERIEREKKESEEREREAKEKEAAEKEKEVRERLEKQAKELKERAARERIARAKLEMEAREREIREKAEREAREKAERELREKLENETKERLEREMKEREAAREKTINANDKDKDKDNERNQEIRRKMEEYKRRKEKEEQERKFKMDKEAREQEFRERRERREREKAEREAFQLAAEREAAEKAAREKAREEAVAKFAAARDALAAKRAAAIAAGARGLSPSPDGSFSPTGLGLGNFSFGSLSPSLSPSNGSEFGLAPPNSLRKNSIRAVSAPRSPELASVKPVCNSEHEVGAAEPLTLNKSDADAEDKGMDGPVKSSLEQESREREQRADGALTVNESGVNASLPSLPLVKVELVKEEVAAAEAAVQEAGRELEMAEASIHEIEELHDHDHEEQRGRFGSRDESEYSVEESYTGDEADEEETIDEYEPISPRHEEHSRLSPVPNLASRMTPESMLSDTSSAYDTEFSDHIHGSSASSSNVASAKPYSTLDPDKIVIAGVYLFNTNVSPSPIGKLESGRGSVTDGLILRITTEGMFIDDDIRGVAERDWDVKAWTMSLVEVWCPVLRGGLPNVNHAARPLSSDRPNHHKSFNILRHSTPSVSSSPTRSSVTDEESANCLVQLFKTCRETCYGLRSDNTGSALGDYHVIRTTVRDVEGKSFVFVLRNEEAWKVSVGLQRLKRGSQVRAMGVCGLPVDEAGDVLHGLGWI